LEELKEHIPVIREELQNLRNLDGFQPYRGPSWISNIKAKDGIGNESIDRGSWNVYYLFLHDIKFDKNIEQCPRTIEIIEKLVPRQYNHAFFSAMNPGTHIMKHHGPTNKKLRLHIPLIGVEGARMRVHTEIRNLKQDQVSYSSPFQFSN
jgi:aspartate beta-hydroxylase